MCQSADRMYGAFKDKEGYWHGYELMNDPTPSGRARWRQTGPSTYKAPTRDAAIAHIKWVMSKKPSVQGEYNGHLPEPPD